MHQGALALSRIKLLKIHHKRYDSLEDCASCTSQSRLLDEGDGDNSKAREWAGISGGLMGKGVEVSARYGINTNV